MLQCLLSCGLIFFGMNIPRFSSLSIKTLLNLFSLYCLDIMGNAFIHLMAYCTIPVFESYKYTLITSKIKEEKRFRIPPLFQQLHHFCPQYYHHLVN